ncbi:hypothetical protein NXG27_09955 [Megasphaera paucivorans]|jgi:hypothetical protein|uniref:Carboxypeptidase regulatory-like domain-containing protein n=1 Tax=Megasphaera paucivorans TaxID=349095 RepID=A0A1G9SE86_9FIRM|nr:hypothetical protein [Megasphaera paucivorans]SDM33806.1 hypothetical protein SAMN05660299_00693 [Megasphaera paucivorans]
MKRMMRVWVFLVILVCGAVYVSAAASDTGGVRGVVTWKYSKFIRERGYNGVSQGGLNLNALRDKEYAKPRGDVGAKIELIPVTFNKNSITDVQERLWYSSNLPPEGTHIFFVEADNAGYYEINDVPAGEYMLFIVSAKARAYYAYPENEVLQYIRNWDYFNAFVLDGNEYSLRRITIQKGQNLTVNREFEYTVRRDY